ncbi:hypothetical protein ACFQLX_16005 [Streptomyces polyrhachis]|uniref:Uncharacterized protein n=1 Tax=Streptomyces polyrhachis TaxID=1282885 RepID=A0ABW2GI64_9ACTN
MRLQLPGANAAGRRTHPIEWSRRSSDNGIDTILRAFDASFWGLQSTGRSDDALLAATSLNGETLLAMGKIVRGGRNLRRIAESICSLESQGDARVNRDTVCGMAREADN